MNATPRVFNTRTSFVSVRWQSIYFGIKLTALNLTPFSEMPCHNLFNIICNVYPSDVDSPVLSHETSNATHIISIVGEFITP